MTNDAKKQYDRIVARNRVHNAPGAVIVYTDGREPENLDIGPGSTQKRGAARYVALRQRIEKFYDTIIEIQLKNAAGEIIETFDFGGFVNGNEVIGLHPMQPVGSETIQDYLLVQEQGNKNSTVALKSLTVVCQMLTNALSASHQATHMRDRELWRAKEDMYELRLAQAAAGDGNSNLAAQALQTFGKAMEMQTQAPTAPPAIVEAATTEPAPPSGSFDLSAVFQSLKLIGIDPSEVPAESFKAAAITLNRGGSVNDAVQEFLNNMESENENEE